MKKSTSKTTKPATVATYTEGTSMPELVVFNDEGKKNYAHYSISIVDLSMTVVSYDETTKVLRVRAQGVRGIFQVPEKFIQVA